MTHRSFKIAATLLGLASFICRSARADSIIVQGLGPQKVTATGFTGARLQYQTDRGVAGERDYGRIQQLVIDSEPALSAAEAAFAAKKNRRQSRRLCQGHPHDGRAVGEGVRRPAHHRHRRAERPI